MPITPDAKDWTWVLLRPCPQCGFDATSVPGHEVPELIRRNASEWQGVLRDRDDGRVRPRDDCWSALEYACHVRDVFRLFDQRLHLMLDDDDPTFPNWDQDATAIADRYNDQDQATVALELQDAAGVLARSFESLSADDWSRMGSRSDGARFSVETFARYLVHDPVHHLHDVTQSVAAHD
jgi:hypothetical protein